MRAIPHSARVSTRPSIGAGSSSAFEKGRTILAHVRCDTARVSPGMLLILVSFVHIRLYPEEQAAMKDPAEALLEPGEYKKSDMFFEYRVKEGEEVRWSKFL